MKNQTPQKTGDKPTRALLPFRRMAELSAQGLESLAKGDVETARATALDALKRAREVARILGATKSVSSEALGNMDWPLVAEQKDLLLRLVGDCSHFYDKPKAMPEAKAKEDALEGIINLLDALQDEAEARGDWTFPKGEYE